MNLPIKILALDLGTYTGFAYNQDAAIVAGTFELASDKERSEQKKTRMDRRLDLRAARLYGWLWNVVSTELPHVVIFEDVQFTTYTAQVQLWSSLRGVVWSVLRQFPNIIPECVPVKTLKLATTGHGSADKGEMAAFVKRILRERVAPSGKKLFDEGSPVLDDNAIDALALWHWANTHLAKIPV